MLFVPLYGAWREAFAARLCFQERQDYGNSNTQSCGSARPGNQQTAHSRAVASDFLCNTRISRRLDRLGYAHFRRWKLYGEEALARHPTVIWLHGDALTVEYQETPLAQYTVRYQPDKKHFKAVLGARRFEIPYRSLQGRLWELDETMWHLAKQLPEYARRKRQKKSEAVQLPLLEEL